MFTGPPTTPQARARSLLRVGSPRSPRGERGPRNGGGPAAVESRTAAPPPRPTPSMEYPGPDPLSSSFGDQLSRRLLETRTIVVNEAITASVAGQLTEQFTVLDAESSEPIECLMNNAPGGDYEAGLSLYDLIRSLSAPVTILGGGRIAGAGVVAFLGVPADRRCALPHVWFQFEPFRDPADLGPAEPPESRLEAIRDRRARIVALMATATGHSDADVEADLTGHRGFDADEAVAYGLVDRIVQSRENSK